MLDAALAWAARGFRVFPLAEGTKDQPLCAFTKEASTDEAMIRAWWNDPATGQSRAYNIGVLTTDMVVVDIDVRDGRPGIANFLQLGCGFDTLTVRTPSGGMHCYYMGPDSAGRQGKYGLGAGLDIRSHGNYVVAPGSVTAEGSYSVEMDVPLSYVPAAVAVRLKAPLTRDNAASFELDETPGAVARAAAFLASDQAPPAVEGQGGDDCTYRTACRLRDLGLTEQGAMALLLTHWNERCDPPWEPDELQAKVENAYNYATGHAGSMSPETHFAGLDIPPPPLLTAPVELDRGIFAFGNALDIADVPARPWLMTRLLMRGHVTVLGGAGAAGKSVTSLAIAAHLALGLPFLGFHPRDGASKSIIYDEEDDLQEQTRRLYAICQHFRFDYDTVRKQIVLLSRSQIDLRITEGDPPVIAETTVRALATAAVAPDVGLVVLGPLVALHNSSEDDNVKMAFVLGIVRELAVAANVAILLLHHVSKPSGAHSRAGDAGTLRGAGAIVNSARFAFTMFTPTKEECDQFGVKYEERYRFVRFDDAKMNHALQDGKPNWLKKHSLKLQNGDEVGVLAPYDMEVATSTVQTSWATTIAGEMRGKHTASVTMSEAVNMLRAGDALAAALPIKTLNTRVMTALSSPVATALGTLSIVADYVGGKFEKKVVLQ